MSGKNGVSKTSLSLVLDLHNYEVMNSKLPGDIKDMWLTYLHKRGIRTDLINCRGLMVSNFLANSPMTWLNYKLIPYVAKLNIIPETQVATQQGVQTRDVMSSYRALNAMPNATTRQYMLYSVTKRKALTI